MSGPGSARFDGNVPSTSIAQHRTAQGLMFSASFENLSVPNNGVLEFLLRGTGVIYLTGSLATGGDADVEIFEDAVVTADGTPIQVNNRNRTSLNSSTTQLFVGPTITADGTGLGAIFIPGALSGGVAGNKGDFDELWILKSDSNYLIRVQNLAAGNQPIQMQLLWYEPRGNFEI